MEILAPKLLFEDVENAAHSKTDALNLLQNLSDSPRFFIGYIIMSKGFCTYLTFIFPENPVSVAGPFLRHGICCISV